MTLATGVGASRRAGARAAGEAVSQALAAAGGAADVVVLFAAGHPDPRPLLAAAREAGSGARIVGCAAAGVLSGDGEVEDGPGVVAAAIGGLEATPFLCADPADLPARRGLALVFADSYSRHPDEVAGAVARTGASVAGVVAVAADGAFPAHRWLDGELSSHGVAGLFLERDPVVAVTQACKPVGPLLTVTAARGKVIETLDDRPAFAAFAEPARPLLGDLRRAAQSIFVALEDGDVIRGILQFDPDRGLLALSDPVPVGARLRFAVRDAFSARADLRRSLDDLARRLDGRPPRLGFYFNCAGRGRGLYGVNDHDVAFIQRALGPFPLCGAIGGGELAGSRLHLFSGVLAILP